MDRSILVECFNDTQRAIRKDPVLARATQETQAGTRLFLPGFDAIDHPVKSVGAPIDVVEDTTFHCAQRLVADVGRVAVLNFANAFTPGGGVVHGAMAQEECLCRSSNLYNALTLPYLIKNYYKHNSHTVGDLGTDAVIYSPGVTVFKNDDVIPIPLLEPFRVDVLTCAAPYVDPNRKHPLTRDILAEAFTLRIRNILEVAIANDVDCLVLGAFGCGAFNNPPDLVAERFNYLLRDCGYADRFVQTVFAIKAAPLPKKNYTTFRQILVSP